MLFNSCLLCTCLDFECPLIKKYQLTSENRHDFNATKTQIVIRAHMDSKHTLTLKKDFFETIMYCLKFSNVNGVSVTSDKVSLLDQVHSLKYYKKLYP